jgi:hypothetical protein
VRDIPVTEVKAKLLHFLDEVERGATFLLRHNARDRAPMSREPERSPAFNLIKKMKKFGLDLGNGNIAHRHLKMTRFYG